MTKVLGTKLSTLWTRINTVLVPRQATVTTTGSYHIVTLQNAVTPTPDALVSFSIPASSGDSGDANQNAFSNVKVGSSTISATSITDTLSVTAGNNISLSVNSKTLTISATDTTYTAATVAPLAISSSSVTGTSTNYARQDHTHSIAVTTGDLNGQVKIAGTNVSVKGLKSAAYTESSAYLPSNTTIPTAVSQLNNDAGYLTSADIPEGASAYSGTISTVTSGTATAGTNNGFARGDHVHNITTATITNALGYTPYSAANPNGYTSNTGTVTGVKINNTTKTASSGIVDLGTVLTTYTYTLPTASTTTLGGIKIGNGLSINSTGVVSATVTAAVTSLNSKTGTVTITGGDNISVSASSNTITISLTDAYGDTKNPYGAKTQNYVLAGPTTGSAAAPSFRALVAADIPPLDYASTDTKNTAGATATNTMIYLIGATASTTNPQTYTIDSPNGLYYSNGLYSHAYYLDIMTNGYIYHTALDQGSQSISIYSNDISNNTYNRIAATPSAINILANNPSSSVIIESPNNGTHIHNVVTPTANADAVNKQYVDNKLKIQNVYSNFYSEDNNWATVSAAASSLNIGDDGRCYYIAVTNLTTTAAVQLNIPTNVVAPVFALCGSVDSTSGDSTIHTVVAAANGKINIPAVTSGSFSMIAQYATPS